MWVVRLQRALASWGQGSDQTVGFNEDVDELEIDSAASLAKRVVKMEWKLEKPKQLCEIIREQQRKRWHTGQRARREGSRSRVPVPNPVALLVVFSRVPRRGCRP